ncbi:MAG: Calx-beta domain-containing protein [Chitinophagaceae bacterium]
MYKNKWTLFCCFIALLPSLFVSCKKDSDGGKPIVTITDTAQTVSEGVGTAAITFNLSKAPSADVKVEYELSGTAILNGDYEMATASPITIAAGSTTATIQFTVYDDAVPEADKTIHVKLVSSDLSFTDTSATITIHDNDVSNAANGLQVNLLWDAGAHVNLDLYVANNVQISNNEITDFDLVSGSQNKYGFESVLLNNSATDGEYYIVAYYESGSRAINYTLNWNSPSFTDVESEGSFTTADVGYAQFWGPVTKSGSSYSKQSGGTFSLKGIKPYTWTGKIKQ